MENQEERCKSTIYPSRATVARWEAGRVLAGCKSKSDFAEQAINFYAGYLSAKAHSDFFAAAITQTMSGIIGASENRLARLHFKTAVEMAKLSHTVASQNDIDDETLRQLHIRCVEEVKRINGVVRFEDAVRYQHDK